MQEQLGWDGATVAVTEASELVNRGEGGRLTVVNAEPMPTATQECRDAYADNDAVFDDVVAGEVRVARAEPEETVSVLVFRDGQAARELWEADARVLQRCGVTLAGSQEYSREYALWTSVGALPAQHLQTTIPVGDMYDATALTTRTLDAWAGGVMIRDVSGGVIGEVRSVDDYVAERGERLAGVVAALELDASGDDVATPVLPHTTWTLAEFGDLTPEQIQDVLQSMMGVSFDVYIELDEDGEDDAVDESDSENVDESDSGNEGVSEEAAEQRLRQAYSTDACDNAWTVSGETREEHELGYVEALDTAEGVAAGRALATYMYRSAEGALEDRDRTEQRRALCGYRDTFSDVDGQTNERIVNFDDFDAMVWTAVFTGWDDLEGESMIVRRSTVRVGDLRIHYGERTLAEAARSDDEFDAELGRRVDRLLSLLAKEGGVADPFDGADPRDEAQSSSPEPSEGAAEENADEDTQ
ncbi:MAG: hypothetical protein Q4G34_08700 [Micrococcus sp.]|nr:hypothetical protein [Micrococcus sp.]